MINTIKQLWEQLDKFTKKYKLTDNNIERPLIFKQIESIAIKIQHEAGVAGKSF